jgi:hypothetical protein
MAVGRPRNGRARERCRGNERGRNLTWWQFLLIVIVYAASIQVGGRVIGAGLDADHP